MDTETKLSLIKEVGEEIVTEEELRTLLETKQHPFAYDGFEPSGSIHIAQGILRAINVNKMVKAGCFFKMWVADWFAWMNNKMAGSLEHIQAVGEYMIETWKVCGMELDKVEFIWAKDVMDDAEYWKKAVQIARVNSVKRIVRCAQIMGRSETESLSAAQILYPCMQAADIFHLEADITQLGMDQRKVNMLAREVAEKLGFWKPVVVSHHMLMGLGEPPGSELHGADRAIAMKMSKSRPDTAIFMTDTGEDIIRKVNKAYCPEGIADDNPLLDYCRHIIFEKTKSFAVERPKKFGGDIEFGDYAELEAAFIRKQLHPMDLKNAVARELDICISPVREHFEKNAKAKRLLEQVNGFAVTR